jgi:3-phytase
MRILKYVIPSALFLLAACNTSTKQGKESVLPVVITEPVQFDSDDPAIWIHPTNPESSLILGTDKEGNENGALYVFDLTGKIDTVLKGFDRPNNVDIRQGCVFGQDTLDIAVVTERNKNRIRVMSLPDMRFIDQGGIQVFEDSPAREVMGVGLYLRPTDKQLHAIVSRKENPDTTDSYLYQYLLEGDSSGQITGRFVRMFGRFSGTKEIEAVVVDDALGFVYYSDEGFGVRKYHADPLMGNVELASFGLQGFVDDREGISIYHTSDSTGYILVSDQGANRFQVFRREGTHQYLGTISVQAVSSDGSEVTHHNLSAQFPQGLFVAMSDNKTFELYDWRHLNQIIQSCEKE